jgi:hypothetical protein
MWVHALSQTVQSGNLEQGFESSITSPYAEARSLEHENHVIWIVFGELIYKREQGSLETDDMELTKVKSSSILAIIYQLECHFCIGPCRFTDGVTKERAWLCTC